MQNCNFTDCQFEPQESITDGVLRPEDKHLNVDKTLDDGKTSRTRYIYCSYERFLTNPDKRIYTCTDGEPWRPYPLPRCLIGWKIYILKLNL